MSKIVTILWRDIPAQVTAKDGRNVHRVSLSGRFQQAIDRAAMEAGLIGTDAYLDEWRQEEQPTEGDPAEEAANTADQLEEKFTAHTLNAYVANGGLAPAR